MSCLQHSETARIVAPGPIEVRVLKYGGTKYRHWNACLAQRDGSLLVLDGEFEHDVQHHLLGEIPRGTRTIEYYWLDRWYNVFRFFENDGKTRLYYCNVNVPPVFDGATLTYIDLDIDILVQPDLSYEVLDLDEFDRHAALFGYDDETKRQAQVAARDLVSMIEARQFPFGASVLSSSVSSVVNHSR